VVACLLVLASRSSLHVRCVALHESQTLSLSRVFASRSSSTASAVLAFVTSFSRVVSLLVCSIAPVASWGRPSFVEFPRCLVFVACFLVAWILSGHQLFRNNHPSHVVRSVLALSFGRVILGVFTLHV